MRFTIFRPRYLIFAAASGIVISVVALGGGNGNDESRRQTRPSLLPVATILVEEVPEIIDRRTYTGEVVPRRATDLSFERAGKIVAIDVLEGEHVQAGAPLASLDTRRLEVQIAELRASRSEAQAKLDELIAGPRWEEIEAARARVAELSAKVELAGKRKNRIIALSYENLVSDDELHETVSFEEQAVAALAAARYTLEELELGSRPEAVAAQRARVEQLDARIGLALIEKEDSVLRAPYSGIVARRMADVGQVLMAGESVVRLIENRQYSAWIGMPRASANALSLGAHVELLADGRSYSARIRSVLPELDESTRIATVIFDLDPTPALAMHAGQILHFTHLEVLRGPGLAVPHTALVKGSRGLWACYSVAETQTTTYEAEPGKRIGQAERRDVEILYLGDDRAIVRGALSGGDRIIQTGAHRLVDGQWVAWQDD